MKISKVIEQTKEYERLSSLIENIEKAVKDFDRVNKVEGNVTYANGTLTLAGGVFCGTITANSLSQPTEMHVDVF